MRSDNPCPHCGYGYAEPNECPHCLGRDAFETGNASWLDRIAASAIAERERRAAEFDRRLAELLR